MTQPLTNPQVALQAASRLKGGVTVHVNAQQVIDVADMFLRWLDANTPPPPDRKGETG